MITDLLLPKVREEYERLAPKLGERQAHNSAKMLSVHDIIDAHFLIANFFYLSGAGIAGIGPRDIGLLHSAVSRQSVSFGSYTKWTNIYDIGATLLFGLIKNHPFYDANKRTAFLSCLLYLYRNKRVPQISHQEFEDFTVQIADDKLEKFRRYQDLKLKSEDPEIEFISYYLKKNTRELDREYYTITFNDLDRILRKFGFGLANPRHNRIDVVKYVSEKSMYFGKTSTVEKFVCQIGFPGWTKQVTKTGVQTVRDKTGLVAEKGFDSQVFYKGLDETQVLIAHYQEPLERLAFR